MSELLATAAIAKLSRCGWDNLTQELKLALAELIFSNLSNECVLELTTLICSSNLPEHAKINFRIDQATGDLILSNKSSPNIQNANNTSGNGASSGVLNVGQVAVSAATNFANNSLFRRDSLNNALAQHLSPLQALQQSINTVQVQHQAAQQQAQIAAQQVLAASLRVNNSAKNELPIPVSSSNTKFNNQIQSSILSNPDQLLPNLKEHSNNNNGTIGSSSSKPHQFNNSTNDQSTSNTSATGTAEGTESRSAPATPIEKNAAKLSIKNNDDSMQKLGEKTGGVGEDSIKVEIQGQNSLKSSNDVHGEIGLIDQSNDTKMRSNSVTDAAQTSNLLEAFLKKNQEIKAKNAAEAEAAAANIHGIQPSPNSSGNVFFAGWKV